MSKTIVINIEDGNGENQVTVRGPATAEVTWENGKIGTIVIENFRLGTKYKTKHSESFGMSVTLITHEEPKVEIVTRSSTTIEKSKFHLIPSGKGALQIWS